MLAEALVSLHMGSAATALQWRGQGHSQVYRSECRGLSACSKRFSLMLRLLSLSV